MFGDLDRSLNASRGLSALAKFLVKAGDSDLYGAPALQHGRTGCTCTQWTEHDGVKVIGSRVGGQKPQINEARGL